MQPMKCVGLFILLLAAPLAFGNLVVNGDFTSNIASWSVNWPDYWNCPYWSNMPYWMNISWWYDGVSNAYGTKAYTGPGYGNWGYGVYYQTVGTAHAGEEYVLSADLSASLSAVAIDGTRYAYVYLATSTPSAGLGGWVAGLEYALPFASAASFGWTGYTSAPWTASVADDGQVLYVAWGGHADADPGGWTGTVSFDSIVLIPEPAGAALLGVGALAFLARRTLRARSPPAA